MWFLSQLAEKRIEEAQAHGDFDDLPGTGQPLLALAGFTRNGRDFDYLARHLKDVRLIRLDRRLLTTPAMLSKSVSTRQAMRTGTPASKLESMTKVSLRLSTLTSISGAAIAAVEMAQSSAPSARRSRRMAAVSLGRDEKPL